MLHTVPPAPSQALRPLRRHARRRLQCPANPTPPRPAASSCGIAPPCLAAAPSLRPHLLRMGPYDFRTLQPRRQGLRLAHHYDDLAPYYDKRGLIGVFGSQRVWRTRPMASSGPRPPLAPMRKVIKKVCDKLRFRAIPSRLRDPHQAPQRTARVPLLRRVRTRLRGQRQLRLAGRPHRTAMKTGNLEVRTGAMVREVVVAPTVLRKASRTSIRRRAGEVT